MRIAKEQVNKIYNRIIINHGKFSTADVSILFSYIHGLEDEINMRLGLETKYLQLQEKLEEEKK